MVVLFNRVFGGKKMKRIFTVFLLVSIILFSASCSANKSWIYNEEQANTNNEAIYKVELAEKNNDVIYNMGDIKNIEKLDDFFKNLGNGESKKIRIAIYTIKDEPVLYDLNTNGHIIMCRADNTRIKGSDKKVREYTFLKGEVNHNGDMDYYYLCNNNESDGKLVIFSKHD